MPSATATVSTTKEIKIKPALRRKLLNELRVYAELKSQRDAIDTAMAMHRSAVNVVLDEVGEKSIKLEGFTATLVEPVSSKLDPKKLIAQGVTEAQIDAATVVKPGRAYVKVTVPGAKDDE